MSRLIRLLHSSLRPHAELPQDNRSGSRREMRQASASMRSRRSNRLNFRCAHRPRASLRWRSTWTHLSGITARSSSSIRARLGRSGEPGPPDAGCSWWTPSATREWSAGSPWRPCADRGQEADEIFPSGSSRVEVGRYAEKVELDMFVAPRPVAILAVDDPGLLRMKLQAAFCERPRMASNTDRASSSLLQWTMASSA